MIIWPLPSLSSGLFIFPAIGEDEKKKRRRASSSLILVSEAAVCVCVCEAILWMPTLSLSLE